MSDWIVDILALAHVFSLGIVVGYLLARRTFGRLLDRYRRMCDEANTTIDDAGIIVWSMTNDLRERLGLGPVEYEGPPEEHAKRVHAAWCEALDRAGSARATGNDDDD